MSWFSAWRSALRCSASSVCRTMVWSSVSRWALRSASVSSRPRARARSASRSVFSTSTFRPSVRSLCLAILPRCNGRPNTGPRPLRLARMLSSASRSDGRSSSTDHRFRISWVSVTHRMLWAADSTSARASAWWRRSGVRNSSIAKSAALDTFGHDSSSRSPMRASTLRQSSNSWSKPTVTRGQFRLPASASSTCRSHIRVPSDGSMSSRRFREAATSRGFRTDMTTSGVAPLDSTASIQNSISRQKRGSLTTNSGLDGYSVSRTWRASFRYLSCSGEAYQPGLSVSH